MVDRLDDSLYLGDEGGPGYAPAGEFKGPVPYITGTTQLCTDIGIQVTHQVHAQVSPGIVDLAPHAPELVLGTISLHFHLEPGQFSFEQ